MKENFYTRCFKIASLMAILNLSDFSSAHSSRVNYGGYDEEDYPGESFHRQFCGLRVAKAESSSDSDSSSEEESSEEELYHQPRSFNSTRSSQPSRPPLRLIQPRTDQTIPRQIVSYPARSALWLTETPPRIAGKYTSAVPRINTQATLELTSTIVKTKTAWDLSIENQGELGTCASFAVTEAMKFLHERLLSQPYLIVKAEARENCLNDGLTIGSAMAQVRELGVIGQKWWSYNDYVVTIKRINKSVSNEEKWNVCATIPQDSIKDEDELIKYGVNNILNLFANSVQACTKGKCTFDKSDTVKKAMTYYKVPVVIGVPVEWNKEWSQTGIISTMPKKIDGLHAIILYGYNDYGFLFKNSWGTTWGRNGLGTISFQYIQQHAHEAWIAYEKVRRG